MAKSQPAVNRIYEDFEPYYEWAKDEGRFTVMLPGFRRDQLQVQVSPQPALKLKGERQIIENRWRRFNMEFPIPSDYDLEKVTAKFEGGRLHVKFAKQVTKPKEETANPTQGETPKPKEPSQNVDKPKAKEDEAEARTNNNKVSDQKGRDEKGKSQKSKTETEKMEAVTANKAPEAKDAKPISRFKTRVLDFTTSSGRSNQVEDEALNEELDTGPNKQKRLVNCSLLTLLVVGIGLYAKSAFTSSHGGSKFQEL